jgi:hypothetical protein
MVMWGGIGVGMSKDVAQGYRDKAAECLAVAERSSDPIERIELLQIARGYLRLADRVIASSARAPTNKEVEDNKQNVGKDQH